MDRVLPYIYTYALIIQLLLDGAHVTHCIAIAKLYMLLQEQYQ